MKIPLEHVHQSLIDNKLAFAPTNIAWTTVNQDHCRIWRH